MFFFLLCGSTLSVVDKKNCLVVCQIKNKLTRMQPLRSLREPVKEIVREKGFVQVKKQANKQIKISNQVQRKTTKYDQTEESLMVTFNCIFQVSVHG